MGMARPKNRSCHPIRGVWLGATVEASTTQFASGPRPRTDSIPGAELGAAVVLSVYHSERHLTKAQALWSNLHKFVVSDEPQGFLEGEPYGSFQAPSDIGS